MRNCPRSRFTHSFLTRGLLASAVLLTLLGPARQAQAQVPPILQPSNYPWFATFNFGPSIGVTSWMPTQFKIGQEIGYHLMGGSDGPALGGSLEEAFGGNVFRLQVGPKFWWDIQPSKPLALYLVPQAKLGFALASPSGGSAVAAFNLQFGFEVKIVLGQRGILFFRPLTFDMFFGDFGYDSVAVSYDLMFAGGVAF